MGGSGSPHIGGFAARLFFIFYGFVVFFFFFFSMFSTDESSNLGFRGSKFQVAFLVGGVLGTS